ncbi:hypothetical protein E2C01_037227 [Portunus trituberculatus]|uniref:Uncharacterized protein n=1 Tax=Portunus trituberculatus TaxID=210409 RepID=A0A5B7FDE8_PORTR|nr:hypothetical protein [Portunus trituberculatus]
MLHTLQCIYNILCFKPFLSDISRAELVEWTKQRPTRFVSARSPIHHPVWYSLTPVHVYPLSDVRNYCPRYAPRGLQGRAASTHDHESRPNMNLTSPLGGQRTNTR